MIQGAAFGILVFISMDKKKKNSRSRQKKPKVVLQRNQVIILTAAIVAVCICMLCVAVLTAPPSPGPVFPPERENRGITADSPESDSYQQEAEKTVREHTVDSGTVPPVTGGNPVQEPADKAVPEKTEIPPASRQESVQDDSTQKYLPEKTHPVEPDNKTEPVPGTQPFQNYRIPEAVDNATLVFVFDDGGQNLTQLQPFLQLPFPVCIAVMPQLPYSAESATRVRDAGKELMLHQPMQAQNLSVNPGPGAITPDMHTYEIEALLRENLAEIGPVAGINNHEGSLITESIVKIGAVLDVCRTEGIYFLDSRTTAATAAPQAALERGMQIWERDIFLDNTPDRQDIINQILQGLKIANRDGYAIMIGHVWSGTTLTQILLELYPQLIQHGYRFTTIRGLYENFGN